MIINLQKIFPMYNGIKNCIHPVKLCVTKNVYNEQGVYFISWVKPKKKRFLYTISLLWARKVANI